MPNTTQTQSCFRPNPSDTDSELTECTNCGGNLMRHKHNKGGYKHYRPAPKEKTCRKCEETKPISSFRKRNDLPDGHTYVCKECVAAARKHREKSRQEAGQKHISMFMPGDVHGALSSICSNYTKETHTNFINRAVRREIEIQAERIRRQMMLQKNNERNKR